MLYVESTSPVRRRRLRPVGPLGAADRAVLEFAAEHRFVLADQVAWLLGVGEGKADARLRSLGDRGCLCVEQPLRGQPDCHRILRAGLRAIGSELSPPRPVNPASYRHDAGVGWLMLAAERGRPGAAWAVVGERRMRSHDARRSDGQPRFAVRLGGYGHAGRERLHYPDLLVVLESGHRIAFELELSGKGAARRNRILGAYAGDARIDAVMYLVEKPAVGRAVAESAARMGAADLVHVHRVRLRTGAAAGGAEGAARALERGGAGAGTGRRGRWSGVATGGGGAVTSPPPGREAGR